MAETSAQVAPLPPIYACINKTSGAMRHVTGAGKCKRTETEIYWNTTGPKGDTGDTGPQGPQGVPGVSFDTSKFYVRIQYGGSDHLYYLNDDVSLSCTALCSPQETIVPVANYPFGATPDQAYVWTYEYEEPGACFSTCSDLNWLTIYIFCVPRS